MSNVLEATAGIMLLLLTGVAIALPCYYQWATKGAWRTKPVGVHLMSQSVVVALLLFFTCIGNLIPLSALEIVAIVLYGALAVIKFNQIRLIHKTRIERQHRYGSPDPRPEDWSDDPDDRDHLHIH